jgi:charged multivesicular body protein 6
MGSLISKTETVPKPKKLQISSIDRALLDLKNSRDRLQRYRARLEADNDKLLQGALLQKQAGKKERALGLLRLRKYKQMQLSSVEDQLLNVLTLTETIDSKQNERQILDAMTKGKDALAVMHKEHSVEKVIDLMEQISEENSVEQEITDILAAVPELSLAEEEALKQELAAMDGEVSEQELPIAPTEKLPAVKASATKPTQEAVPSPQKVALPG